MRKQVKKRKKSPYQFWKRGQKWRQREVARSCSFSNNDGSSFIQQEEIASAVDALNLSPTSLFLNTRLEDPQLTTGRRRQRIELLNNEERNYQQQVEKLSKEPQAVKEIGEKALWSEKRQKWQSMGLAFLSAAAALGSSNGRLCAATSMAAEGIRSATLWRTEAEAYNKATELEALNLQVEAARHAENLDNEHRRHLHDLTGGLRSAGSESERDMWEQRLSRQQSLTTVASLLFAAGVALIVEGDLPNSAAKKNIFNYLPLLDAYYFVTALGLGLLLFVVVGGVKLSNWLNAFMFKRVAFYNDFLDVRLRIKYSTLRSILRKPTKSRGFTSNSELRGNDRLRDEITDLLNQRVCMLRENNENKKFNTHNNNRDEDYVVTFSKWYEMECASFSHCIDKAFHIGTLCVMIGLTIFVWARLNDRNRNTKQLKSRTAASLFVLTVGFLLILVFVAPRFVRKNLDTNDMRLVCCTGIHYVRPAVYSLGQVHDRVEDLFDIIRIYARQRHEEIAPGSNENYVQFDDILAAFDPDNSPIYDELQRGLVSADLDASLPDVTKIFIDALRRSFPKDNIERLQYAVQLARDSYKDHLSDHRFGRATYLSSRRSSLQQSSSTNDNTLLRRQHSRSPTPLVNAAILEQNLANALFFAHQRSATRLDYTLQDDNKLFSCEGDADDEDIETGRRQSTFRPFSPSSSTTAYNN